MKTAPHPAGGGLAKRLVLALATIALLGGSAAAQGLPTEQSVRAAMTFNFLRFTEFPPESGAAASHRLHLCFSVGDPAQAEALAALAGHKVGNRELAVARIGEQDSCQVIYVDSRQRWTAAGETRPPHPAALTIGSYRGFVEDGGMIEIDLQDEGNRFDINLAQARLAHFRMSPQLLRLARRIHE
ncbi:MAG TPA: YfiR family protein [Rhodocyclaceae bacterium]